MRIEPHFVDNAARCVLTTPAEPFRPTTISNEFFFPPSFLVSVFSFLAVLFLHHYCHRSLRLFCACILFSPIGLNVVMSRTQIAPLTDRVLCYPETNLLHPIPFNPFIHCSSSPLPVWTLVTLIAFPSSFRTAVPALISILGLFPVRHSINVRSMKRVVFYLFGFIHWLHVCTVNA